MDVLPLTGGAMVTGHRLRFGGDLSGWRPAHVTDWRGGAGDRAAEADLGRAELGLLPQPAGLPGHLGPLAAGVVNDYLMATVIDLHPGHQVAGSGCGAAGAESAVTRSAAPAAA